MGGRSASRNEARNAKISALIAEAQAVQELDLITRNKNRTQRSSRNKSGTILTSPAGIQDEEDNVASILGAGLVV